ncbi:sigma E protease regulator RseP [Aliagarivorans taiwanensis]|uniref:sigma E protease regulator RseP n=1 Tax=Aliagarivorans taiwanensis TaxID=561966 RepID=UPI0003F88580|nr:sigma E protease regulator RseP [Aliagarivorans taiwanensis]
MAEALWNAMFFVITLGILVTVHEFGHFWVARRCGVKVERFSIGFGKALWRRMGKDGTEYVVAMIPLGGYVKMLDERVEEVPAELKQQAFTSKSVGKRSAIVAAGPIANFLLAIFAFWLTFMIGVPSVKPVIGELAAESIAARSSLQVGDQIITVDGQETIDWEAVNLALVESVGQSEIRLEVRDSNQRLKQVTLDSQTWELNDQQSPLQALGLLPFRPEVELITAQVVKGDAAEQAGIQVGDELLSIDGEQLASWPQFVEIIQASPEQTLDFTVKRGAQLLNISVRPGAREVNGELQGYVGIAPTAGSYPEEYKLNIQYGLFDSLGKAVERTWQLTTLTVSMIGKLVTGVVSLDNLSGPISIAKGAGATADYGLVYFLGFVALVSVNLGIINLFPLPVLDGGHLLFFAVEVATGKPVSERVQDFAYRLGAALVMGLMVLAVVNDVMRL